jgi:hypothetical protein
MEIVRVSPTPNFSTGGGWVPPQTTGTRGFLPAANFLEAILARPIFFSYTRRKF